MSESDNLTKSRDIFNWYIDVDEFDNLIPEDDDNLTSQTYDLWTKYVNLLHSTTGVLYDKLNSETQEEDIDEIYVKFLDYTNEFLEFVTKEVLLYLVEKSKKKETIELGLQLLEEVRKTEKKPFDNYKELLQIYNGLPEKIKNLEIKIIAENKEISQQFKERIIGQLIDEGTKYIATAVIFILGFTVMNYLIGS